MGTGMQTDNRTSIHLDIPFYRQHFPFTCGPASLMMAMKYLDTDLHLAKGLETDIWREANLVAIPGTSRYGLAYSASVRDYSASVTSNTGGIDFVDRLVPPLDVPGMQILKDFFHERKNRCRQLGVREKVEPITGKIITKSLLQNHVPLIVTNSLFSSKEDLPHWVTVTGIDDEFMYFNNPSDGNPRKRKVRLAKLQTFVGYHGDQSMVEVWKQ